MFADVAGGRLIRVEGRNGTGKSTLLKVVAGVCAPSAGRVTGRPRCGYVPERFPGGLPFTARDYLLHLARVHGLRGPAGPRAVDEWLERLGAASFARAPLRTLSKGMTQKVAIAQALLPRPGLLVLDEAWTGLDQAARGTLEAAAAERADDGAAVLFVDHDPARLAGQASERWRLDGGGRVTVLAGDNAAPAPDARAVLVIEADGIEAASLALAGELPGVLAARARPAGRVTLRVAAGRSDEALRALLAWDGVHVAGIHEEAAPPAASRPEETGSGR
jgi:ABC-type Mn2+/Zn2+ transport system ATPase subunit